jgi:hypothetical protein
MQVFNLNWSKLAIWLLPISLRKRKIALYVIALIAPIRKLYIDFVLFRDLQLYEAEINGQTIKLERVLNDTFDATLRRIHITDGDYLAIPVFYEEWKNRPVIFYEEGNSNNPIFYEQQTIDDGVAVNFYVNVPSDVFFDNARMRALVNKYKVAGRKFEITIV